MLILSTMRCSRYVKCPAFQMCASTWGLKYRVHKHYYFCCVGIYIRGGVIVVIWRHSRCSLTSQCILSHCIFDGAMVNYMDMETGHIIHETAVSNTPTTYVVGWLIGVLAGDVFSISMSTQYRYNTRSILANVTRDMQ